MIQALLLLCSLAQAQEVSTSAPTVPPVESRLSDLEKQIRDLQNGRPTIPGKPTYLNGISFSNAAGSAITFNDQTTLNTAPSAGVDLSTRVYDFYDTQTLSAASSVTFHYLNFTTYDYRLEAEVFSASNAGYYFRCADVATNTYAVGGRIDNNAGAAGFGYNPGSCISLSYDTSCAATARVLASNGISLQVTLRSDVGKPGGAAIILVGDSGYLNDSSQIERATYAGRFSTAPAIVKCSVIPTAGNLTGTARIGRLAR